MELSLLRPLLKNNFALLLQYAAGAALPLLLVPHLARTLGLEAFGTLSVTLAWATYATALVHYAFHLTGPARAARGPALLPRLVAAILQARLLLLVGALAGLAFGYALGAIPASTVAASLLILALLPLSSALDTTWHLQATDRFPHIAALSIVGTAVAVAIGLRLVVGPDAASLTWAAAALIAGAVTVGAGSFLLSLRTLRRLPRAPWSEVGGALREGRPLFASQLVALAYGGSGPIVLGWLASMEQAGTYSVLARLVMALCAVAELVHTAAYPTLARLFGAQRGAYLGLLRMVVLGYLAVAATVCVLGWAFRAPVLAWLYGAQGAGLEGLYLLGLVWILSGIFGGVVTGYFVVSGQPEKVYRLNLVVMVVSLATGIPAAMAYGAAGWVFGILAGQAVIALSAVHHWSREHALLAQPRGA